MRRKADTPIAVQLYGEAGAARIAAERRRLAIKPWEFAPSEVYGRECSYPVGSRLRAEWDRAAAMCGEILARDSDYFTRPPKED